MLSGKFEPARMHLEMVRQAWSANRTANRDRLADLARTHAELEAAQGCIEKAKTLIDASLAQFDYPSEASRAREALQNSLGMDHALTRAALAFVGDGARWHDSKGNL